MSTNHLGSITQVGGTVTAPTVQLTDQASGVSYAVIQPGTTQAGAGLAKGGLGTTSPGATWDVRGHSSIVPVIICKAPVKSYTVTSYSRTSNVATLTLSSTPGFIATESVSVTGVSDATFNTAGANVIAVTATTVTYANTGSNVGTTASSGTVAISTTTDLQQWVNSSNVAVASVGATGIVTGIGSGLTALNGSNISTGTVAIARGGTAGASAITGIDNLMTQGSTIVAGATTDLSAATGQYVEVAISLSPTITSFGTVSAGAERVLRFSGTTASITHNATSLILPGGANITVANNDRMTLRSLGSGNWICIDYIRAASPPASGTNTGDQTITLTGNVTGSGTGSFATTIQPGVVTNAMLAGSIDLTTKVTGALPAANFPALTGDVSNTAGSLTTAIGAGKVTNAMLAGSIDLTTKVTGYLPTMNGGAPTGWNLAGGRLTTENGVPVSQSDRTGQATLYYVPFVHNWISLADASTGTIRNYQFGTGGTYPSVSLSGLTAGKNYDVFAYYFGGSITLSIAGAWTNDTTRSVAIVYDATNGAYYMSGNSNLRYLGTFRATGATNTADAAATRYLYNAYNKVPRSILKQDTGTGTVYNTSTWTGYGAGVAKAEFVFGMAYDQVDARFIGIATGTTGATSAVGITLDSTSTAPSAQGNTQWTYIGGGGYSYFYAQATSTYTGCPGVGYHYLYGMMFGGGNNSFYGGTNTGGGYVAGTVWI